MPTLQRNRFRIKADAGEFAAPKDFFTSTTVKFWRGTDLQFEIGVFFRAVLQSIANLASITIEIKEPANGGAPDPATAPLMMKTVLAVDLDDTVDDETFANGTKQHALAVFTNTESNIPAGNKWLLVYALDDLGQKFTLAAGLCQVVEDGGPSTGDPEALEVGYYNEDQIDALLAAAKPIYISMFFSGTATDEQGFGYFKAKAACQIQGMQIFAQVAPTGRNLTLDLINGVGAEQSKVGTLTAGSTVQETTFGTPLTLAAGDVIQLKIKSVGSTEPGDSLTVQLFGVPV
jgi:hypothetical protein